MWLSRITNAREHDVLAQNSSSIIKLLQIFTKQTTEKDEHISGWSVPQQHAITLQLVKNYFTSDYLVRYLVSVLKVIMSQITAHRQAPFIYTCCFVVYLCDECVKKIGYMHSNDEAEHRTQWWTLNIELTTIYYATKLNFVTHFQWWLQALHCTSNEGRTSLNPTLSTFFKNIWRR